MIIKNNGNVIRASSIHGISKINVIWVDGEMDSCIIGYYFKIHFDNTKMKLKFNTKEEAEQMHKQVEDYIWLNP